MLLGFVVVLVVGAGALAFYGSSVQPEQHSVEQVLPDDRFPR
jgi:hypothetical protein